jgi:lantibiotic modifying enzyme
MMLGDSMKVDFLRDKLYCKHIPPDIINSEIRYLLDGSIPYFFHDGVIGGISDYYGNHFSLPGENYKNHLTSSFISYELGLDDMKKQVNLITIILDSELQNLLFKRVNNDV